LRLLSSWTSLVPSIETFFISFALACERLFPEKLLAGNQEERVVGPWGLSTVATITRLASGELLIEQGADCLFFRFHVCS
jgi:hypothetical protein